MQTSVSARICKTDMEENVKRLSGLSGDEGDRTPGLGVANAALSHLSYIPTILSELYQTGMIRSIQKNLVLCDL